MTVLIADGVDFRKKNVTRNKGGHLINSSIPPQVFVTTLNVFAPNKRPSKMHDAKTVVLQREINKSTVIKWRFQHYSLSN